jgi:alpha-tubulin suppressor-like RCC1 family protein
LQSLRALVWFGLAVFGCGSRSGLSVLDLASGVAGESGGTPAVGGSSASGGRATGGGPGRPSGGSAGGSRGGVSGTSNGGAAGSAMGGGVGGEPSAGSPGEGGSGGAPREPPRPVALALGAFTSCIGFDDGGLRCWGTGGYIGSGSTQTIGDDETPDVLPPVAIGEQITQISSSWYHTCALLDSGDVRCFGHGGRGRLGYGNAEHIGNDETPASAGDVNVGGQVRQVSAGPAHTCALLHSAKVRCWGENQDFQLGYADSVAIGDDESPASVGFVDVGAPVLQVSAGYVHTCAVTDSNGVRCWGKSIGGSLGYGNLEIIGDDESPADAGDVNVGGKVVQLAAGMLHTCALLDTGNVRCWGAAHEARLGYGNYEDIGDDEAPADAGDVNIGGKVMQIAAGAYATCALLASGGVRCWGSGQNGELGYGNTEDIGDDETPADAGDVPLGAKAIHIDVGFLHACAILETGAVRCWGRASPGSLGYGNTEDIGDNEFPVSAGDVKLQ